MSGFSGEWLALREPADHAARSRQLTREVMDALSRGPAVHALDLASGTGSNFRFLAPYLSGQQQWLLVDDDAALLAEMPHRMAQASNAGGYLAARHDDGLIVQRPGGTSRIEARQADLRNLQDSDLFESRTFVTASALLDLVSEAWLERLAMLCQAHSATVLFALTYDGRIECVPGEEDDRFVRDLVNRHQRLDKGFGPALGPRAASCVADSFMSRGYQVRRARSDWPLSEDQIELQHQLIEGWSRAATAMDGTQATRIARWTSRRLEHVHAGRSRIMVGHEDMAAFTR